MTDIHNYGAELGWELGVDFPIWGNTEIYVKTVLKDTYLKVKHQKTLTGALQQQ